MESIARFIVDYDRNMTVVNTEQLPKGLGCKYLLVLESPYPNTWIAKKWMRKLPKRQPQRGERILRF